MLQQLPELFLPLLRDPACQHHGGAGAVEPLLRLGHGDLGGEPVGCQLQLLAMGSLRGDLAGQGLFLLGQALQRLLGCGDAFPGSAGAAAEGNRAEAEVPQAFLGGGQLILRRQQQHVLLALVLAHREDLRLLGGPGQGLLHILREDAPADGAQHHRAALGALGLQRQIQALPGRQALDQAALAAFLRADPADPVLPLVQSFGQLFGLLQPLVVQQHPAFQLGLGAEQRLVLRSVAVQQLHRALQRGLLGLQPGQLAAFPVDQTLGFLLLQSIPQLGHLHAAQPRQLSQQLLLLGTDQHQPQAFHFYNGHVSPSLSFPL